MLCANNGSLGWCSAVTASRPKATVVEGIADFSNDCFASQMPSMYSGQKLTASIQGVVGSPTDPDLNLGACRQNA